MSAAKPETSGTHEFKAEIKQLLDILIHSVYTSKDVFVRELISNATDALEKVRFMDASGTTLQDPDLSLEVRIETDKEKSLLVVSDSGVGMTADEVEANIGTIAHSGATAFLEQLKRDNQSEQSDDVNLIGRFGVGFYSVFMVAKKVVLTSRSGDPSAEAVVWTSDGAGTYTLDTPEEEVPRGTRIEIHLNDDDSQFADEDEIKSVIQRYSNFVPFPVLVNGEQINQTTALWREPASQIEDSQYDEFYKLVSHDFQEPMLRLHHSVEGTIQYSALLFVPKSNPEMMGFGEGDVSLQLYVQRVLIDGNNQDCLPKYLRFVKGVVESEDIPLNVSRETLQQNQVIRKIRDKLTSKLLDQFLTMAEKEPEKYKEFWNNFNRFLKEGYSDFANREKLQELLRFNSSRHDSADDLISLSHYVEAMPSGQSAIYYLSGPSREALDRESRLELFRKNKVEVLYLYDMADEFVLESLGNYQEKKLISADNANPEDLGQIEGGGDLENEKSEEDQEPTADISSVIARFKAVLGDRVIDVKTSERLVNSPACIVGGDEVSGHMEKMIRMMNKSTDFPKRIMELNAKHSLIQSLAKIISDDPSNDFIDKACNQLFEGCMLLDGYLTDPHTFVERMNDVLDDAAKSAGER
jgi:molecular chaperone HtpG